MKNLIQAAKAAYDCEMRYYVMVEECTPTQAHIAAIRYLLNRPIAAPKFVRCIRNDYLMYLECCEMDHQFEDIPMPRFPKLSYSIACLRDSRVGVRLLTLVCKLKGHVWEDDSYGGPESGCMAGHCTRCGHSFHHQLY